jgi:hypothetical protein
MLAGGLLLGAPSALAQDATDGATPVAAETSAAAGGANTTLPRTGVGALAGAEGSWLSIGAIAGAAVAAAYAARERMTNRR